MKKQPAEWDIIFANDISEKELVSRIYRELTLDNKKISKPIQKWAKDLNRHFSKKDTQMANKHMEKMPNIIIIKEIQIKTIMKYRLMTFRMVIIKKTETP